MTALIRLLLQLWITINQQYLSQHNSLPQQEEQAAAAPAEQASPSSSRSLLTSLPPGIAGQFPTQDNADATADEWREEMNDFYKQKMQMRGTVAIATLA